jgi:hypothetical protein
VQLQISELPEIQTLRMLNNAVHLSIPKNGTSACGVNGIYLKLQSFNGIDAIIPSFKRSTTLFFFWVRKEGTEEHYPWWRLRATQTQAAR